MQKTQRISDAISWILAVLVVTIGILNLLLIHPVPGMIGLLLSLAFFPPVNKLLLKRVGFTIPFTIKMILAATVFWFTLGISDLGDLID
jgi:hypothetical protein